MDTKKIWIIVGGIIVLIFVVGSGFYFYQKTTNSQPLQVQDNISSTNEVVPTSTKSSNQQQATSTPNVVSQYLYYEAGTIQTGKYKGYKRVISLESNYGDPGRPIPDIFITNDYKTFFCDNDGEGFLYATTTQMAYSSSAISGTFEKLNKNLDSAHCKSTVEDIHIPSNHSTSLSIGGNFYSVVRDNIYLGRNDDYNYFIQNTIPVGAKSLASSDSLLKIYSLPIDNGSDSARKYLDSDNTVLVQDSTGLIYQYTISNKTREQKLKDDDYTNDSYFSKNDFISNSTLYDSYGMFLPGACSGTPRVVKNVTDNDLQLIAKTNQQQEFFTLRDSRHALNQAEYDTKVGHFDDKEFGIINKNIKKPTYEEYIAKNPILLTKDPWGRWLAFGETVYYLEGGCGKPVLYFYPETPTKISIKFKNPISLTTDIPTYANGWKVLAYPDGTLKDMQPEFTDCQSIDDKAFGSEYAKVACLNNIYPYIYWSGFALHGYPSQDEGWVVSQKDLLPFITEKLIQMGLDKKETTDMTDYWVPELLKKSAPYYRISFLQNSEMSAVVPMSIEPHPDSLIRVFMDWSALSALPVQLLKPQQLLHYDRKGFTVVEWGGLK